MAYTAHQAKMLFEVMKRVPIDDVSMSFTELSDIVRVLVAYDAAKDSAASIALR